ncbi:MAG: hypothetical protein RML40_10955 [Bacteroidota bacterium]|nr:hypothetical protein [Candidatus Kapabacteria bacterium]MDW8221033.1 hypothetical protein [Bacteroidota bacterium]
MGFLVRHLTAAALQREKLKDYRNIVMIQVTVIIILMTLEDLLTGIGLVGIQPWIYTLFIGFAGFYLILLWDMMRNFTSNMLIIRGMLVWLSILFVLGAMGENPFKRLLPEPRPYYIFIHTSLVVMQAFIISLAIRDIFSGNRVTNDKLWGSACVYLMIGFAFGDIFDLLNLLSPGCFGVDIPIGFASYLSGVYFSYATLGGVETGFDNMSRLVRNVSVIESLFGNLYLVFLIGRILGLPMNVPQEPSEKHTVQQQFIPYE